MPKHVYLLILLTFVTGMATGAFIFFSSRDTESVDVGDEYEYEIIASTYGGCRMGCASIRFLDDGSYTYMTYDEDEVGERIEDKLSRSEVRNLTKLVREAPLQKISDRPFRGACPTASDGLGYQFSVDYGGQYYEYDSCIQDLSGEPLFETLIEYFATISVQ